MVYCMPGWNSWHTDIPSLLSDRDVSDVASLVVYIKLSIGGFLGRPSMWIGLHTLPTWSNGHL